MDIFLLMDPDSFDAADFSAKLLNNLIEFGLITQLKKDVRFLSPAKIGYFIKESDWLDDILSNAGMSDLILVKTSTLDLGITKALNYILHNGPSNIGRKIVMI